MTVLRAKIYFRSRSEETYSTEDDIEQLVPTGHNTRHGLTTSQTSAEQLIDGEK